MITDVYKEAQAKWLVGANPVLPQVIALGTGTAGVAHSNSVLDDEYYRQTIDFRWTPKRYTARFAINLPADTPPPFPGQSSITFTEIGLFDGVIMGIADPNLEVWSGSPEVPAYWSITGTADGGSADVTKSVDAYQGSYAAQLVYVSGTPQVYQDLILSECVGKSLVLKAAVKTSSGTQARIAFNDGSTTTYSSYHTGGGSYELLQLIAPVPSSSTRARIAMELVAAGTATFDWFQCFQSGKMWARSPISREKTDGNPLNLSWEIIPTEEEDMIRDAYEMEELTPGTASAGSLDPSKYAPAGQVAASQVIITVEDNPIRYWMHSGTPTATAGHLSGTADQYESNHPLNIEGANNIQNLRFIGIGGTAKLKVSYLR